MYLKRLELNGFKSFAKKTTLLFETPIAAIVGPNGSGKSNVAEAFRWSLGEQSMKSLRGRRGEDLIFNGSRTLPRGNRANVTLVFDNTKKHFELDFGEVAISREVYRDGTNEYFLNGSQVRLRDILELLGQVSLGASSHHIISQNEADRILSASPKVRKMMVEDALGLRVYHWKIAESEKKLEKTKENMREANSLKRELGGHLRFLSQEAEKIKKAKEFRDALRELYRAYLAAESHLIEEEKKALLRAGNEPKRELASIETALKNLSGGNNDDAKTKDDTHTRAIETLDTSLANFRKEKDDLERHIGRIEGMLEMARPKGAEEQEPDDFSRVEGETRLWRVEEFLALSETCASIGDARDIFKKIRSALTDFRERGVRYGKERVRGEVEKLEETKKNLEEKLKGLSEKERALALKKEELRYRMDEEAAKKRAEERTYYETKERYAELRVALETLRAREERAREREESFARAFADARAFFGEEAAVAFAGNTSSSAHPRPSLEEQAERRKEIERLKIRIEEIGPASDAVFEEYQEALKKDGFLSREIDDLEKTAVSLKKLILELEGKLEGKFKNGIEHINKEFQRFFELMFGGGTVALDAVVMTRGGDEENDLLEEESEEGIDIAVNLPRKKIRSLEMLSGGERALTSIALLFAMSQVNPPPFLILDETDAALDEANSKKYSDMLENLAKRTQLILITHNRETMSRAGVLYGVTMGGDGVSRLLSVKFEEAVQIAK